ncbi:MAG: redoxin domain-containing protein [Pseudohongiella sp.]|nr:redoxin domain-containing protein [Pseudohongiella sp.]MDO9521995.1 redoxin domain-containing protein [Pseudohongiella sp.]MDP2128630.1 redoxin domain-containing protein [Pseudohongiella sp.]
MRTFSILATCVRTLPAVFFSALAFSGPVAANEVSSAVVRAADFTLLDQQGKAFNLHYHAQRPAVLLMAHASGSDYVTQSLEALNSDELQSQGVAVALINQEPGMDRAKLLAAAVAQGIRSSILQDEAGLVASTLDLRYAGEILLLSPQRWEVVYRGPALNEAGDAIQPALAVALQALIAGNTPEAVTQAMSLAEALPRHEAPANVSYTDVVAPMLLEKCAGCHRPGGIAPWAMTSHAMVQGFSPMIRETVLTRRMPPWHADPAIGEFMHDMSLSVEQKQQLLSWIDAGAQRGTGADPLTQVDAQLTQWSMGEPDYIVTLPEFDIPATGSLDYQFFEVPNTLDRDVWVKAVQIAPGDRQVVHHAIATFGIAPEGMADSSASLFQPQLMTFVPGNDTYIYPEDTGVFIPAGTSFFTQMHYTTYGRETRDQTKIGLYFADEAPAHVLQHYSILNQDLNIPAGAAEHEEGAYYAFQRDAVIYSLFPHAHYRGRSSEFVLRYPDGREELVLSVPNYDFNWQRYFQFEKPIAAPAGTQVIHRTTYDNSTANLSNPDPTVTVRFGEQTWEEMLYGGISFRYAEARENDFEINVEEYFASLGMGMFDKNMDGKVSLDEMPERSRQQLALAFAFMDKDKTGGLEFEEFRQFMIQTNMMGRD